MGMAASQARYLSLCARMNDIEFQGQQINQQRTTLSNQATNYYNSLLDLSVPTPPSTKDFTKIVYSGNYRGSKFSIGNVTPGNTKNTYNIDLNYTKTGHSWSQALTASITKGKQYYEVKSSDDSNSLLSGFNISSTYNRLALPKTSGTLEESTTYDDLFSKFYELDEEIPSEKFSGAGNADVFIEMTSVDWNKLSNDIKQSAEKYEITNTGAESPLEYSLKESTGTNMETGKTYLVKFNALSLTDSDSANDLADLLKGKESIKSYLINTGDYDKPYGDVSIVNHYDVSKFSVPSEINGKSYLIVDASGSHHTATESDFYVNPDTGEVTLKNQGSRIALGVYDVTEGDGKEYISTGTDGDDKVNLGSGKTEQLISVKSMLGDNLESEQNKAYIEGLKNAFPNEAAGCTTEEFLDKFVGWQTSSNSGSTQINLVKRSDITGSAANVSVYQYVADGQYTDTQSEQGCQIEFGVDGRIKSIGIPTESDSATWSWISISAAEETDTNAYEDAFNQYEYDKYIYDKKQNEINAKISIIQQEDKNLELKLTRLDNERNAVNTELEAVKKVVSDNIEKSYKTFSG